MGWVGNSDVLSSCWYCSLSNPYFFVTAAVVEGTIFCAHAGLSPQLYDLDLVSLRDKLSSIFTNFFREKKLFNNSLKSIEVSKRSFLENFCFNSNLDKCRVRYQFPRLKLRYIHRDCILKAWSKLQLAFFSLFLDNECFEGKVPIKYNNMIHQITTNRCWKRLICKQHITQMYLYFGCFYAYVKGMKTTCMVFISSFWGK